jgi:ATP-binding cassette subfamily F protein uup
MGAELDPTARVRDAVARGQPPTWEHARLLERFWFDRDAQWAPVGTLSGGERRRLQLLLVLAAAPNVLLLDEPTNDLDLDTLRALEDFLEDWPGALLTVSHDRSFLERTVDDVLALDGEGGVAPVVGGVEGYVAGRRTRTEGSRRAEGSRPERARGGRSPSTLRRLLGQAERALTEAQARRDRLVAELAGAGGDHVRLAGLGEAVAGASREVAAAEDRWLELAAEAEAEAAPDPR